MRGKAGVGELWQLGGTAVILHNVAEQLERGQEAVTFCRGLITNSCYHFQ